MYVEILAYFSSDWRSIGPNVAIVQAYAQWRPELLAASENHLSSQLLMFFLYSLLVFFRPTNSQF